MKKWIVLILSLVLAVSMAACGGKTPGAPVTGEIKSENAETIPAPTGNVEAPAEEPSEMPEETENTESVVTMGRIEGGTYINEYTGYACELDSNWVFYSAEELQVLPDNVKELIADTQMADIIGDVPQFTDMMAENVDEMATINALYQKHTMQERVGFAMLSDTELIDVTLEQRDMMEEAYAQAGMEVESMERITVTFLGKERVALKTVGTTSGVPFYMVQVFDYHLGQYSVTLTINSYLEDNTQRILDLFYPIN